MKLTKQGVRDLNHIRGFSNSRKVDIPGIHTPIRSSNPVTCEHPIKKTDHITGETYCPDCHTWWDWNTGRAYSL